MTSTPADVDTHVVGAPQWPDPIIVTRAWLLSALPTPSPNVRTETNDSFGTATPDPTMTTPLVLLQRIPGGGLDDNFSSEAALIDVTCFGADRAQMWSLYRTVHAQMLRLSGRVTDLAAVDLVTVTNGVGELDYKNPGLRRCVTTYRIVTRPI